MQARFLLLALTLKALGCADPAPCSTAANGRPIFQGQPDTVPAHAAVVALTRSGRSFCTGTLISRQEVITAAHCTYKLAPADFSIFFGADISLSGETREVSDVFLHPDFNWKQENDLSIVRLKTPAPDLIQPLPVLPAALALTQADVGRVVDFSGFGDTENGGSGVKMHVPGSIAVVCPGPGRCPLAGDDVGPQAFGYLQPDGGPCRGDSGGPAFLVKNGLEFVAGLTSYGDAACTVDGISTDVSAFEPWIREIVAAESCTGAQDDDGDGLTDCRDPDCYAAAECPEDCGNNRDDDGDGLTDCRDPACYASTDCPEDCADDRDDDGDDFTDCFDLFCSTDPRCIEALCSDTRDNDGDNLTDCADPDCRGAPECAPPDACTSPGVIRCGQTTTGTTSGGFQFFSDYTCPTLTASEQGPEVAFRIDAPAGVSFRVELAFDEALANLDLFLVAGRSRGCDPAACLAESTLSIGPEALDGTVPEAGAYFVVETLLEQSLGSAFSLTLTCSAGAEVCDNDFDDDQDGEIDCDDEDCARDPACLPAEVCDNGLDDDQDGQTDCADQDCEGMPACSHPSDGCGCNPAGGLGGPAGSLLVLFAVIAFHRGRR